MNIPSHTYNTVTKTCTVLDATEFPSDILQYSDMEVLQMPGGELTTLPTTIQELKNLRIAFFPGHNFTELPSVLRGCSNLEMVGFRGCRLETVDVDILPVGLRAFVATDNTIRSIDGDVSRLQNLQKIMLTGNQLTALPKQLLECRKLELIRIANNQLAKLPAWIFELPELAWFADSGNPYSFIPPTTPSAQSIALEDIQLEAELGKSANNSVRAATYQDQAIAVKLFGSQLSTDGSTDNELLASLLAGDHPHIPGALHQVVQGDAIAGITMHRMPSMYKNLGRPPDFHSLTRDVYEKDFTPDYTFVAQCLRGVSAALAHLHTRGIAHGDVYAHNIAVDSFGNSKLLDFGAASLYKTGTPEGDARQQLDRRAFSILASELLVHAATSYPAHSLDLQLQRYTEHTLTFQDIAQQMKNLRLS